MQVSLGPGAQQQVGGVRHPLGDQLPGGRLRRTDLPLEQRGFQRILDPSRFTHAAHGRCGSQRDRARDPQQPVQRPRMSSTRLDRGFGDHRFVAARVLEQYRQPMRYPAESTQRSDSILDVGVGVIGDRDQRGADRGTLAVGPPADHARLDLVTARCGREQIRPSGRDGVPDGGEADRARIGDQQRRDLACPVLDAAQHQLRCRPGDFVGSVQHRTSQILQQFRHSGQPRAQRTGERDVQCVIAGAGQQGEQFVFLTTTESAAEGEVRRGSVGQHAPAAAADHRGYR